MLKPNYRSALVTGASSGLGRGLAEKIAAAGIPVVLVARRIEALETLAASIRSKGGKAWVYRADVGVSGSASGAVSFAVDQMGSLDLLICNAGVSVPSPLKRLSPESIEEVFRINVLGTTNFIATALPHMIREQRGHLVAVSSLAAFGAYPQNGAYCASKAALNSFMRSIAAECHVAGIQTTTICPGFIETPMTEKNKFPMPFLMKEEPAVARMWQAIVQRRRFIAFPWQTRLLGIVLARTPQWLLLRYMAKNARRRDLQPSS